MDVETLWSEIVKRQGEPFYTAKKLPFTYVVKGGELFVDRRKNSITKSTFRYALEKIQTDPTVNGPKKLGVFGAPYVWGIVSAIKNS